MGWAVHAQDALDRSTGRLARPVHPQAVFFQGHDLGVGEPLAQLVHVNFMGAKLQSKLDSGFLGNQPGVCDTSAASHLVQYVPDRLQPALAH